jgi:hypothetical protein
MKTKHFTPIIAFAALGVAFSVQAHDPKEHMKDAENPNCAAMKNMDHSKMDMKDPVMQAMMKPCMHDMQQNDSEKDKFQAGDQDNGKNSAEQHSEHQH